MQVKDKIFPPRLFFSQSFVVFYALEIIVPSKKIIMVGTLNILFQI